MTKAKRNEPLDPVELAAELIRRPSVTPKDAGTIPYLASVLERVGFRCDVQEFAEPGTDPIINLYARIGTKGRNLCFAGHTDVVPAKGAIFQASSGPGGTTSVWPAKQRLRPPSPIRA